MRYRLLVLTACVLTACGGGSSDSNDCFKQYWNGEVGVCLPQSWRVIDRETMQQRGVPDDALVAFQSDQPVSGQFLTVTVTREQLSAVMDGTTYSQANIRLVSALPGYELVDATSSNIDGETIDLHIFAAQPIADEPARRFYQISTVANGLGYSVTATTPRSVDEATERQIISIVQSSTFKVVTEEGE